MAESITTCGVCSEEFNKNSMCPRILSCFHTLCTSCIQNLIRTHSKQCPFCRMNFTAPRAVDVAVNHTMLELMKYVSTHETNSVSSTGYETTPHNKRIDTLKQETVRSSSHLLVTCQDAQKRVEKAINEAKDLNLKYCQENTKIENVLLPKINGISSQNTRNSENLDKTTENLLEKLKEVKGKQKQLEELKGKLDTATSFRDAAAVMDVAEETNSAIREWIENFKEFIADEEKNLEASQKEIKITKKKIDIMVEAASSEGNLEPKINTAQASVFRPFELTVLFLILFVNIWPHSRDFFRALASIAMLVGIFVLPAKWRTLRLSVSRWWRDSRG